MSFSSTWLDFRTNGSICKTDITDESPSVSEKVVLSVLSGHQQNPKKLEEWDDSIIHSALLNGALVHIWSNQLQEWIIWVYEERGREIAKAKYPKTVVYTLDELKALIQNRCPQNYLASQHEAKRILDGRFICSTD